MEVFGVVERSREGGGEGRPFCKGTRQISSLFLRIWKGTFFVRGDQADILGVSIDEAVGC